MPDLPVELHREIYRLACMTDGGLTGCALSLVSRAVRDIVAEFRWHSIAVAGIDNIERLWSVVDTPFWTHQHRVKHLCISDLDRCLGNDDDRRLRQSLFRSDTERSSDMSQYMMHPARNSAPNDLIADLLRLLAPNLETLSLVLFQPGGQPSDLVRRDFPRLSLLHFPMLRELTFRGLYRLPISPQFAPKLERLDIMHQCMPIGFPQVVAKNHPALTHLRVGQVHYGAFREVILLGAILGVLSSPYGDTIWQRTARFPLPGTKRFYLLEQDDSERRESNQFAPRQVASGEPFPRFILLPEHPGEGEDWDAEMVRKQWLERVQGKAACWVGLDGQALESL